MLYHGMPCRQIFKNKSQTGEMAQQLKVLAPPAEDLGSVSSTQTAAHSCLSLTPVLGDLRFSSDHQTYTLWALIKKSLKCINQSLTKSRKQSISVYADKFQNIHK